MTRVPKKKLKKMKGRPRGGASVPCPLCQSNSNVALTRRDGTKVARWRNCTNGHAFQTTERVTG